MEQKPKIYSVELPPDLKLIAPIQEGVDQTYRCHGIIKKKDKTYTPCTARVKLERTENHVTRSCICGWWCRDYEVTTVVEPIEETAE